MFKDKSIHEQAGMLLDIAKEAATADHCKNRLDGVRFYDSQFAEPGYNLDEDEELIVGGDWNSKHSYEDGERKVIDDTPGRLANLLQKIGCRVVWDDQWTECHRCRNLVRVIGHSYNWKPYQKFFDGKNDTPHGFYCGDCIKQDFESFMGEYVNNPKTGVTIDVDLTEYGFEQYDKKFENGLYEHQLNNPNPEDIYSELKNEYNMIIFKVDSTGQFDTNWSVYVKDKKG